MKKLCKDCKYYKKYYGYGGSTGIYDECLCPLVIKEKDVVRGEVYITFCTSQRFTDYGCGPDAKYFEQYEPPVPEPPLVDKKLRKTKKPVRIK